MPGFPFPPSQSPYLGMHFYYNGLAGAGSYRRSIFTTAAALASAYYMGGLARGSASASCEAPLPPPPPPSSSSFPSSPSTSSSSSTDGQDSQPRFIKFPLRRDSDGTAGRGATSVTSIYPGKGHSIRRSSSSTSSPTGSSKASGGAGGPYTTSVVAFKGQRSYMEDDFFISKDGSFAGVYDGHGGAAVSKYLRQNLNAQFLAALPDADMRRLGQEKVTEALATAFRVVDEAVVKVRHWAYMGSTAVVVVIHAEEAKAKEGVEEGGRAGALKRTLIAANVGDSRAVLSRRGQAVDLTDDHKPNKPSELERVKALGGTVRWYGLLEQDGSPMEGMGVYRINGNLAVARAFGDRSERPFVSSEAEIKQLAVEEGDEFVILATDGLWDVMSSEEAVNFVHSVMSASVGALTEGVGDGVGGAGAEGVAGQRPADMKIFDWTKQHADDRGIIRAAMMARKKKMARYLSEEAFRRGTSDNVTVVVVWF